MSSDWQTGFFRDVALDLWRNIIPAEMTAADAAFLENSLLAPSGGRLLDVPCGQGRHALALSARGYRLTGVDSSEQSIAEARSASDAVEWILADMCDLPWDAAFDGAYCFGNSFGYLDREGAGRFLKGVARSLKPGARFVVETGMAAESILASLPTRRWHQAAGIYMLSDAKYDPVEGRLDSEYTFIRDGEVSTRPSTSYTLTVAEICRLHAEAGLDLAAISGGTDGTPYRVGSPRLLLTTQKR